MNTQKTFLLLAVVFVLLLGACTAAPEVLHETDASAPVIKESGSDLTPEDPVAQASQESLPAVVAAANDLSKALNVNPDEIEVVEVEAVTWPDASLGCPEPGMFYIQILSPGYRVTLAVAGKQFIYHTDRGETAVTCEEADLATPPDSPPIIETGLEALVDQAREMLAEKLGIAPGEIEVLEARSVVWSDGALGCPDPGMSYLQVPKEGAQIRLRANKAEFDFHIGEGRGLFLCETTTEKDLSDADAHSE